MTPAWQKKPSTAPAARKTRARASALNIEVVVESPLWDSEPDSEATLQRAVKAAGMRSAQQGGVAVLLTDDSHIRVLNRQWRGIDKATNVLSFPAATETGGPGEELHLGDIAIAYETVETEAAAEGKPFHHHLAHLGVHGFLHLIGYDHETDGEAEDMETHERTILQGLDIPDPYAEPNED